MNVLDRCTFLLLFFCVCGVVDYRPVVKQRRPAEKVNHIAIVDMRKVIISFTPATLLVFYVQRTFFLFIFFFAISMILQCACMS